MNAQILNFLRPHLAGIVAAMPDGEPKTIVGIAVASLEAIDKLPVNETRAQLVEELAASVLPHIAAVVTGPVGTAIGILADVLPVLVKAFAPTPVPLIDDTAKPAVDVADA